MIKIGGSKATSSALLAYPGLGYDQGTGWRVHISGIAWQTPVVFNMRQRMMIRMLGGVMQATPDDLSGQTFQERITPFMAEANHRQSIRVTINGKTYGLRRRTRRNGHFADWLTLSNEDVAAAVTNGSRSLPFAIHNENFKSASGEINSADGIIHLQPRTGISVVSDIDDTIKDSDVGDRRELLANTFLREFRSIEGMAAVYQNWSQLGACFHYVSSSPWQLFSALQQLHSVHQFPVGTMHLRNFRLRDQLLKRVIIRRKGKASAIRLLMTNMPRRDFVLVGDSGEKDPKIYHKICREFPGRVKGVFIREVANRPLENERLAQLQDALNGGLCARFSTAAELEQLAAPLFVSKN